MTGAQWELPSVDLLQDVPGDADTEQMDEQALRLNAELLQNVLSDFNIRGDIVSIHPGPVVTLYELEPAPGTKSSRVIGLADDIARSMSATSVRAAVSAGAQCDWYRNSQQKTPDRLYARYAHDA